MPPDAPRHLAVTARFAAAVRARESLRPDALFADPWAAQLAGDDGFAWLDRLPPSAALWPLIRTRFLDDLLAQWRNESAIRQVVLVAAGLDTRAYRLSWPEGASIFELDQPDVLEYKEGVLTRAVAVPQARRVTVAADLRQPWAQLLTANGFVRQHPAIWIIEGLLMYLDAGAARHVLATVAQLAAPGSRLGLDVPRRSIRGHLVDDPASWLGGLGWDADVSTLAGTALRYGRWPYSTAPPTAPGKAPDVFFAAAHRRAI